VDKITLSLLHVERVKKYPQPLWSGKAMGEWGWNQFSTYPRPLLLLLFKKTSPLLLLGGETREMEV
jgi:hypothetical protein